MLDASLAFDGVLVEFSPSDVALILKFFSHGEIIDVKEITSSYILKNYFRDQLPIIQNKKTLM